MGQRKRAPEPEQRPGAPGFFATTLPGLGILLRQEIDANPDLEAVDELGNDGRADVVFFRMRRGARPDSANLQLAEDVFVTLAESGSGPPRRIAESLVTRTELERSLSVWTRFVRHLNSSMSYRVIARVVDESRFKRTELRAAITSAVVAQRPRWRVADPADLELWVLEYQRARFVAGLRLSDKRMRQHGSGRETERRGALRPVVAAAMVCLAGAAPGRMLDPCCGSGTILAEALSAGWEAVGSDLDPEAVAITRENVPRAVVDRADMLSLPHEDATFDAVVSNLPFGRQFPVEDPARWLRHAVAEMGRVTRPGGHVVVLVPPPVPRGLSGLDLAGSYPLRLLGVSTRIWVFRARRAPPLLARMTRSVERHAARRAAAVVYAGGPAFGDLLVRHLRLPPNHVISVPNGFDTADIEGLSGARLRPERNGQPLQLVMNGYWYGRNGPGILTDALRRVGPAVAQLTVIGGVSPPIAAH